MSEESPKIQLPDFDKVREAEAELLELQKKVEPSQLPYDNEVLIAARKVIATGGELYSGLDPATVASQRLDLVDPEEYAKAIVKFT